MSRKPSGVTELTDRPQWAPFADSRSRVRRLASATVLMRLHLAAMVRIGRDDGWSTGDAVTNHDVADVIADVWADLLGTTEISRDAGFFDLGANSVLLT